MADIVPESEAFERTVEMLRGGLVVAVPTETVYGLAGDATSGPAVAAIFEAKRRPRFNPLICHVASLEMAETHAEFSPLARTLAEKFWPGPLTLVLPLKPGSPIHPLVTAGLQTVALRMPKGFVARLAGSLGFPLAAPSANSSGRITATTAAAVQADLGSRIGMIVDGGQCAVGLESTIIKVEKGAVTVLRPGGLAIRDIESITGIAIARPASRSPVEAPGMLTSHYAPHAALRLNASVVEEGEALLGFGPVRAAGARKASAFANLSEAGDLREAAVNLFSHLNDLDSTGAPVIAVEPVPGEGLGEAINDRLMRAAAPRDSGQAAH